MDISKRLKCIENLIDSCEVVADIGTDHAYLPIDLIKQKICIRAIASDINRGPVQKARKNISQENMNKYIECRLGPGLSTIKCNEANVLIIAGMGGNLIRDIVETGIDVFKTAEYAVLQPVQNPEILRKYIYERGFSVINEELCFDENKYYEIIKVKYDNKPRKLDDIDYEISKILFNNKHKLLKKYICYKIEKYGKILSNINDPGELAQERRIKLQEKLEKLEVMKECL